MHVSYFKKIICKYSNALARSLALCLSLSTPLYIPAAVHLGASENGSSPNSRCRGGRRSHRLRLKLPPGPRPLPIVGNLYDIKPVLVRCFTEWSEVYGAIFSVYLGSHLNVVVNSAALAKEVLKDKDQHLAYRNRTRQINKFSRDGMDLIWSDYGPHYVKIRKLWTLELFSVKRLEALRPIREDEVTAMIEFIFRDCTKPERKGRAVVVREYLGMMTFLQITRLTFGKRFIDSKGLIDEQGKELNVFSRMHSRQAQGSLGWQSSSRHGAASCTRMRARPSPPTTLTSITSPRRSWNT